MRSTRAHSLLSLVALVAACGDGPGSDSAGRVSISELRGPETVPKELVSVLVTPYGWRGEREIVVGRTPDDLPFEVPLPRGARIVGTLAGESSGTIVVTVDQSPLETMRSYRQIATEAGWEALRDRGGGFQSADAVRSGPFCKGEDTSISPHAIESERGQRTYVQIHYAKSDRHSPCDRRRREELVSSRGPLPPLYTPRGTSIFSGSGGGGPNYSEASARLETRLSLMELVKHYGSQLRDQGWTARSDPTGSSVVAQRWQLTDRDDARWIGLLIAAEVPGSDKPEVIFRVIPVEPRKS